MGNDFCYEHRCGCRVIFLAAEAYHSGRAEPCGEHAKRSYRGIWRELLAELANRALEDWLDSGGGFRAAPAGTLFETAPVRSAIAL